MQTLQNDIKTGWIIKVFLVWRAALFLPALFASKLIPLKPDFVYMPKTDLLFYPFANFDGVHYLSIASIGYENKARFLPLFPILIKNLSDLLGGNNFFLAGFLIANIAFLLALIFLYKLLLLDYRDSFAKLVILILLIFPTSFFFGAVYAESLFLLFAVLAFWFARKKMWFWSSISAMLLAVTRLTGILLLPALLIEFIIQKSKRKDLISFVLVPVGITLYSIYNKLTWGDALYFVHAHSELGNSREVAKIVLFPQTMFRYIKTLLLVPSSQYVWWIALLEFVLFIACLYLLYLGLKQKIRASYLLFAILAFLLPTQSGTFSGLPRYVIPLFPIFITLANIKSLKFKWLYFLFAGILQLVLVALFVRGYFVA